MDSIINMQAYPTQAPAEYFVKSVKSIELQELE